MKKVIFFGCVILLAYLAGCTSAPKKVETANPQLSQEERLEWEKWRQELKKIQEEVARMDEYWNRATDVFIGEYRKNEGNVYVFTDNWYYKQDGKALPHQVMYLEKNISAISNEPKNYLKFKKITRYIIFAEKVGTEKGEIYRMFRAYPLENEYTKKLNSLRLDSI